MMITLCCLHAAVGLAGYGGVRPFNYFVFGAAVSEVELDVLTGATPFQICFWYCI